MGSTGGLGQAIVAFATDIYQPSKSFLALLAYIIGLALVIGGLVKWKRAAAYPHGPPGQSDSVIAKMLVGVCFISAGNTMGAFTGSIFGTGAIATSLSLDYTSAVGSGAQWSAVIAACLQIIELLGIAFFLKGLWMQQAVFDGKGHVSMGSAFTHMIFGVLGAKLPALVNLVQGSLKTSIFTVS